jgi:hypothetical protein
MVQFLDTSVIGRFGAYFGIGHHFFTVNVETITEMIVVPQLKKPHIQTDVGRVQSIVL